LLEEQLAPKGACTPRMEDIFIKQIRQQKELQKRFLSIIGQS
jgi:hypothetical protein